MPRTQGITAAQYDQLYEYAEVDHLRGYSNLDRFNNLPTVAAGNAADLAAVTTAVGLYGNRQWQIISTTATGAGGTPTVAQLAGGGITMGTANTSGNRAILCPQRAVTDTGVINALKVANTFTPSTLPYIATLMRFNSAVTSRTLVFGFSDLVAGDYTSTDSGGASECHFGIGYVAGSNSNNFVVFKREGASATVVNTGIPPVADRWYLLEVWMNSSGRIYAYIDGMEVGQVAAPATTNDFFPNLGLTTNAAAAITIGVRGVLVGNRILEN